MKLSAIQVKQAKSQEKDYKLFDGEGLFLLVKKNGNKHWRLKYRFLGTEKLLAIGPYPLLSLQEAREAKKKAKKLLAGGIDPVAHKKGSKEDAIRNVQNTFQAIAMEWYENRKHMWKPRYADEVWKRLNEDIFPHIGKMPIKDIEPPLLLEVIRKIEKRGALELAKRQLQKCGEVFRYAIATGRAVRDPSNDIKEALKPVKKTHFSAIEVEELPEFVAALNSNKGRLYPTTQNALWLIMLTFVRTSELINARWDEIDFERKRWIIPAERMKMGKEHIVPLADQAIEILKTQKEITGQWDHVFPSPNKPKQSISNNTILGALKRMGYQGRMTGHGFRSLAMGAIKQELGYRHEVVDRQLAHTPKSKIDKAYDRAAFLDDRTKMMQDWADYIDSLSQGGKRT
jgi:integrase